METKSQKGGYQVPDGWILSARRVDTKSPKGDTKSQKGGY